MKVSNSFFGSKRAFTNAEKKAYAREDLIFNVTEDILITMEALDVTKKELAYKLGKSKSFVTQVLSGARNMTLGSLSDICFALDVEPKIHIDVPDSVNQVNVDSFQDWGDHEEKVEPVAFFQPQHIRELGKVQEEVEWEFDYPDSQVA